MNPVTAFSDQRGLVALYRADEVPAEVQVSEGLSLLRQFLCVIFTKF